MSIVNDDFYLKITVKNYFPAYFTVLILFVIRSKLLIATKQTISTDAHILFQVFVSLRLTGVRLWNGCCKNLSADFNFLIW